MIKSYKLFEKYTKGELSEKLNELDYNLLLVKVNSESEREKLNSIINRDGNFFRMISIIGKYYLIQLKSPNSSWPQFSMYHSDYRYVENGEYIGSTYDNIFHDTIYDMSNSNEFEKYWNKITNTIRNAGDMYKPKQISESITKYDYNSIIIKLPTYTNDSFPLTISKLVKLIELFLENDVKLWNFNEYDDIERWVRWCVIDKTDRRYLILNLNDMSLSLGHMRYLQSNIERYNYTYNKVYEIDDIDRIKNIFKYGDDTGIPNYRPKKFN